MPTDPAGVWGRTFVTEGPPPVQVSFTDDHRVTAVAECNHLSGDARLGVRNVGRRRAR